MVDTVGVISGAREENCNFARHDFWEKSFLHT